MRCDNCVYVEKTHETDEYGNIHIYWRCSKQLKSLYHQVNFSDLFLIDLRSGKHHAYAETLREILPNHKRYRDIQTVEILGNRNVTECDDYKRREAELSQFFNKSTKNVT